MFRIATMVLLCAAAALAAQEPPTTSDEMREVFRLEPSLRHGAKLYAGCVTCHRRDGSGQPEGNVPVIAEQHQRVIVKQLIDYRHSERWDLLMEEVASRHNLPAPKDIADIAGYISQLPRAQTQGRGDGRNLDHGRQLYVRDCQSCHGLEGEGNGVLLVPRLAGQHYRYLLRQLHDTIGQRRPNMPPPHQQLLGGMAVDDLTGLADYLSSIQPTRRIAR
jgi:cytochrome c553